ncbi:MAG: DUF4403 family protein [Saprospiraceae bacterium]
MNAAFLRHATLFIALIALFDCCKSSRYGAAPRPDAVYDPAMEEPLVSHIVIPIHINVGDLVKRLNAQLTGPLYEDLSYTDNNNDNLMVRATRAQDITLSFASNSVRYRIPLKIWAKQKFMLGAAEVEGDLALSLKTTYALREDWTLGASTQIEYHEWLAKPRLKTGLGDISIQTLADLALNRSKKTISESLDKYVSQQLSLKPYVEDAWKSLQEPILLDEGYQMWIKTTPLSISMTPITSDHRGLRAKVAVACHNDVTFGAKPRFRENSRVPNLQYIEEAPDDFQIRIATEVPYAEAERLARQMMVGQEFASGNRKVRIEDLKIWGNRDKLIVLTQLSGSFKGAIYFAGKPHFNADKNQVEVRDLDFHVETRNFLHKSAAWLFNGAIRKQMAAAMTFPLQENMNYLLQTTNETLANYALSPGVTLKGKVNQIKVENTLLTPSGIRVNLFAEGGVRVDVE